MGARRDYAAVSIAERFWARVNRDGPVPAHRPDLGPCWVWTGPPGPKGYGRTSIGRVKVLAHRLSWWMEHGPIPDDHVLDHLCRNRACVRTTHLEPVTGDENTLRGEGFSAQAARATHCPQGHPYDEANTRIYRGRRYCRACNNNGGSGRQRAGAA